MRASELAAVLMVLVATAAAAAGGEVVVVRLDGTINLASQRYVERGLAEAAATEAELVILELDTPGGVIDSTRDILSAITSCTVPVAVYVAPAGARAASAGFFLLLAADVAAMAPGTNTGASHPVLVPMLPIGDGEIPKEMLDKAVSDTAAMVRSLAQDRSRNEEEAVRAVTEIISFTAREALDKQLIDLVAGSRRELLDALDTRTLTRIDGSTRQLDLAGCTVRVIEQTGKEELDDLMASPLVVLVLMAVAGLGIYTEITHPGGILPGALGVIALLLFLYATSVLPVSWIGVALMVVAGVLFILEVKVSSYGLLTLGGIACFVAGALMLFETPIPEMRLSLGLVLPTAVLLAGLMIFLLSRVISAHRARALTGREGLVGKIGETLSALTPHGKVKVYGEYWDACSTAGEIPSEVAVEVVRVRGRILEVAPEHRQPEVKPEDTGARGDTESAAGAGAQE